ncbi:MAG: hypothetical protein ACLR4Z_00480 [Butyricicoccaceae bacterium]
MTSYFASRVPVVADIATILLAVGWALLIGNLAYQALRSMASGVGIEAEEPGRLFLRSATFSFLLVCSRQICDIALSLSAVIMRMLEVPKAVTFTPFNEDFFSELPNAGWLVVIVVDMCISSGRSSSCSSRSRSDMSFYAYSFTARRWRLQWAARKAPQRFSAAG